MGLTDQAQAEILRLRDEYPVAQSALIPALQLAQRDCGGWLPQDALDQVARLLALPATMVTAAATFYTMLQREPVGRHMIQVCTNLACSLLGGQHLLACLGRRLGIDPGQTTPDGKFTLCEVECLGSCGTAPVMQIDDRTYENLTEEQVYHILDELP
jgi:NADH-quinone oxidoreductase E subunit